MGVKRSEGDVSRYFCCFMVVVVVLRGGGGGVAWYHMALNRTRLIICCAGFAGYLLAGQHVQQYDASVLCLFLVQCFWADGVIVRHRGRHVMGKLFTETPLRVVSIKHACNTTSSNIYGFFYCRSK